MEGEREKKPFLVALGDDTGQPSASKRVYNTYGQLSGRVQSGMR